MKLGICGSLAEVATIAHPDFDYIEGNVQQFLKPEAPAAEFAANLKQLEKCGFPMLAANCFLPGDIKVVGPEINEKRFVRYVDSACRRASRAGIRYIVFGSGGARMAPEGWPLATAFEQFVTALKIVGPIAAKHGVTVLVEPLNFGECNVINTVLEGAVAVARAGQARVRLLVDIFHMLRNGESPADIVKTGKWIRHVHIAEKDDRTAPGMNGDDFRPFLSALKQVRYRGAISLECQWGNYAQEAAAGIAELRRQCAAVGL